MSAATTPDPGPFLIDGPEYSDRDREMFVLGFEYAQVLRDIAAKPGGEVVRMVHAGNVGRIVAACESARVDCRFATTEEEGWWRISMGPRTPR